MRPLVDVRRRQGWRVTLPPGAGRRQLAEVEIDEPSVLTVDYEQVGVGKTDNIARVTVTTQIDESQRERELPSRLQGNAWPVPAGRSRIYAELTDPLESIKVQISIAPGVAVTEITPGDIISAPPLAVQTFRAPPYARQVRVVVLTGSADITANGLTWTQTANTPSASLWTPAFATLGVFSLAGATVAVSWQITS